MFSDFGRDLRDTLTSIGFGVALHEKTVPGVSGGHVLVFETTRPMRNAGPSESAWRKGDGAALPHNGAV